MPTQNIKEVLLARTNQAGQSTTVTFPAYSFKDLQGNNIPLPDFRSFEEAFAHPTFNGDSRVAFEAEILAAGYQIKPGETGMQVYI